MADPEPPAVVPLDPQVLFAVLNRHGVDYLVIGGFAVNIHGFLRATADIDVVADQGRDNLIRLARALAELGARLRGVDAQHLPVDPRNPDDLQTGANWTMRTDVGDLDLLVDPPGADAFEQLRARRIVVEVEAIKVPVVGLDDLVAMKLAAGRPKDLQDLTVFARRHPQLGLDAGELEHRRAAALAAASPDRLRPVPPADAPADRSRRRWWQRRPRQENGR